MSESLGDRPIYINVRVWAKIQEVGGNLANQVLHEMEKDIAGYRMADQGKLLKRE